MATGKAVVITASGGTDVFSLVDNHTIQTPGPGDVIIKVVSCSVNPVDCYVRSGSYASPTFPKVIGGDVAGHVFAVGEGCTKFAVGEAVYALSTSYIPYTSPYEGCYAEYVLLKEEWLSKAPDESKMSLVNSSGLPLVYLTALQALERANPKSGQRVLVLGASGGVGQFAIQLSKIMFNLHVTAVCGARNSSLCTSLGADTTWDYAPGADGLVASFSDNKFDIVFDVIGGDLLDASAKVLKEGGIITHVMNRGTNGKDKTYKEASENGTGPKFETTLVKPSGVQLEQARQLVNEGKLTMIVALTLPLTAENCGKAHDEVISGHAGGKIVLTI